MPSAMRIAVVGTGANGAGAGAELARTALDVTFIDGAVVETQSFGERAPVNRALVDLAHLIDVGELERGDTYPQLVARIASSREGSDAIEPDGTK